MKDGATAEQRGLCSAFLEKYSDQLSHLLPSLADRLLRILDDILEKIGALDLKGKPVAVFGLGDSVGYGQDYVDAMEELHRYFEKAGAKMVGYVSLDGYENFTSSRCLIPHLNEITPPEDGEKFCGLPVDEDSENDRTQERVENWCAQLKKEMGI